MTHPGDATKTFDGDREYELNRSRVAVPRCRPPRIRTSRRESPTQNHVGGGGKEIVPVLEGTGLCVIVVTQLGPHDDRLAWLQRESRREGRVETRKSGTFPLH